MSDHAHELISDRIHRLEQALIAANKQIDFFVDIVGGTVDGEPTTRTTLVQRLHELVCEERHADISNWLDALSTNVKEGFAAVVAKLTQPEPPKRIRGYARASTDAGSAVEGEITKMRITDSGWAEFSFVPTDKRGNPTSNYQKGTEKHEIVNDDGTIAEIVPSVLSPDDPLSFRVNAKGPLGAVQVKSSVDGDASPDVETIIEASGSVEIVPGGAVRGELKEGASGEQV